MTRDIAFKQATGYLGRNGYGKAQGVRVYTYYGSDVIIISPVTATRGTTARCEVRIPKDADTLRSLAMALLEAAAEIEEATK